MAHLPPTSSQPVPTGTSSRNLLPTAHDLLRWLLGRHPVPAAVRDGLCDWSDVFKRCERLRLLPQAAARVTAANVSMPAAVAESLRRRRVAAFGRAAETLRAGCRAVAAIEGAGIAVAGFKGIAATGWLHDGRAERQLNDVDILTSPADVGQALDVLAGQGYRPKVAAASLADYVAFVRAAPGSAGNEAISLVDAEGRDLDLHWKLGGFSTPRVLEEVRRRRVLTSNIPLVRPGLGMLLSVQHALRNDFVAEEVTRDLLDLAGWFRVLATVREEATWTEARAERSGLLAPLHAMAEVLADCGVASPWRIAAHRGSRRLAEICREQVEGTTLNTDLVSLCSPRVMWRIVRAMLHGRSRQLDIMRRMEEANGEAPRPLVRRIQDAWGSARRTSPARWLRLRELARAKRILDEPDPGA
jgi:hypothetical protein